MRFNRWSIWIACGLVLGLLVMSPLVAQSLAPAAQVTGAVCPLSDEQTQKATTAFGELATTFTTEPRCVNCHGGVNPFASDADKTHPGGRMNLIFKIVPINVDGVVLPSIKPDEAATNDQCQECHSGLPGWKLSPPQDMFKGRTAVQICQNQKVVFGKIFPQQGPSGFANHIEHDVKNVPFIDNAFQGTRGLEDSSMAIGPFPDPPKNVTHPQLNALARQWADALGSKFQGDEECGCVPHHYALLLKEKVDIKATVADATVMLQAEGQVQIPITFKDDGSFVGNGEYKRNILESAIGSDFICRGSSPPQTVAWSVSGSVEGSDMDNPGVMRLNMDTSTKNVTFTLDCEYDDGQRISRPDFIRGGSGSVVMPDMPAVVGETSDKSIPVATIGGLSTVTIKIVQLD